LRLRVRVRVSKNLPSCFREPEDVVGAPKGDEERVGR